MSIVDDEYQKRIAAMTPAERMERAASLLMWARENTARRIIEEKGKMSAERLRWEVALRHYGHEPIMRRLIEKAMAGVPD